MVNADLLFRVRPSALSALALLHYASPLTSFPSYALLASVHPFIHSSTLIFDSLIAATILACLPLNPVLQKDGPLAKVWLAASMENKLTKNQIIASDVVQHVSE
jgi:hypothetical protein